MSECRFMHVGMTVSDLQQTEAFYTRYFGFKKTLDSCFKPEFFAAYGSLYHLPDGTGCRFGFLEAPDGTVIELFQFSVQVPCEAAVWNKPGYHHICLRVPDIKEICQRMEEEGVEFFFKPSERGKKGEDKYWVFLKDPDGNMIELQQN